MGLTIEIKKAPHNAEIIVAKLTGRLDANTAAEF